MNKNVKIIVLVLFIIFCIWLFRFTPLSEQLNVAAIEQRLDSYGAAAPVLFVLLYAVGVCLFIPGTLLTGAGAVLFGTGWGFVLNLTGASIGAGGAFYIGRHLGRDFAAGLVGKKLRKYDDAIEKNGFATILYLRLLFFPFVPLNFGAGLTKVKFRDYFLGTVIGIIPGSFILTFAIASIAEAFKTGNYGLLLGWKTILAIVLFAGSFFIPTLIKKTGLKKFMGVKNGI